MAAGSEMPDLVPVARLDISEVLPAAAASDASTAAVTTSDQTTGSDQPPDGPGGAALQQHAPWQGWPLRRMLEGVGEFAATHIVRDLADDHISDLERRVFTGDVSRLGYLTSLSRLGSHEVRAFCCFNLSALARQALREELAHLRDEQTYFGMWFYNDTPATIPGSERVARLFNLFVRQASETHAFDQTAVRTLPASHKECDHPLFRTLAEQYEPPAPSEADRTRNGSTHPHAASARKCLVTHLRHYFASRGYVFFDYSPSGHARDSRATTGQRLVRDLKDLSHPDPAAERSFARNEIISVIDQDVYVENFEFLRGQPFVAVTREWRQLAGQEMECAYWCTADNLDAVYWCERVAGADTFTHQRPFNYERSDVVYINHPGHTAFTVYSLTIKFQPGTHVKIVLGCPVVTVHASKVVCDIWAEHMNMPELMLRATPLVKRDNVKVVRAKDGTRYLVGSFCTGAADAYSSIKFVSDVSSNSSVQLKEEQFHTFARLGQTRGVGWGMNEAKRALHQLDMYKEPGHEALIVGFFGIDATLSIRANLQYIASPGSTGESVAVQESEAKATQAAPDPTRGLSCVRDTTTEHAFSAYYNERFKKFKNETVPDVGFQGLCTFFMERFIDNVAAETGKQRHSLRLENASVMYESRTGRLQRARQELHATSYAVPLPSNTFLKKEVSADSGSSPRGVTSFPEARAISSGLLGRMLKQLCKDCEWYQPCNSPKQIAESLQWLGRMAQLAEFADQSGGSVKGTRVIDYTKLDETISEYLYGLFTQFVLAFTAKEDAAEVKKILDECVCFKSLLGASAFFTGYKNNSGSGLTTELNTIINAFIAYLSNIFAISMQADYNKSIEEAPSDEGERVDAFPFPEEPVLNKAKIRKDLRAFQDRLFQERADGQTLHAAIFACRTSVKPLHADGTLNHWSIPYLALGCLFGDDGAFASLPLIADGVWTAAAFFVTRVLGMKLKCECRALCMGMNFLARIYPNILVSLTSYADVRRAISKLRIAKHATGEGVLKYMLKMEGYFTTDSHVPFLREFLLVVSKRIYGYDLGKRRFQLTEVAEDGSVRMTKAGAKLHALDRDTFYRMAAGPYPYEPSDDALLMESVAAELGFDGVAHAQRWLEAWKAAANESEDPRKTWEELEKFHFPGCDFNPDGDPENTVRVAGPAATLLDVQQRERGIGPSIDFDDLCDDYEIAHMSHTLDRVYIAAHSSEGSGPSSSA